MAPGLVGIEIFMVAPASTVGAALSKAKAKLEASLVALPARSVAVTATLTVALLTLGGVQVVEVAVDGKLTIVTASRKFPDKE